jgi:hypothetical protein
MSAVLFSPDPAPWSLRGLVTTGMLDEPTRELLADALLRGSVVLVCGPSDSGRSSVLRALMQELRSAFLFSGEDVPLVAGKRALESGDVRGVPHVLDGSPVSDLERTRLLTGVRRGASGSLAALATSLGTTDAFERVAAHVDLVVTCARRFVEVNDQQVLRRVVTSVAAVEGLSDPTTFKLTELVEARVEEGTALWERPADLEAARERVSGANPTETAALFSALTALERHPALREGSLPDLLNATSTYGGVPGLFAADLLTLLADRDPSGVLEPLRSLKYLNVQQQIELDVFWAGLRDELSRVPLDALTGEALPPEKFSAWRARKVRTKSLRFFGELFSNDARRKHMYAGESYSH